MTAKRIFLFFSFCFLLGLSSLFANVKDIKWFLEDNNFVTTQSNAIIYQVGNDSKIKFIDNHIHFRSINQTKINK